MPPSAGATPTAAVLLAAGGGSRFHDVRHKLLAELNPAGRTVIAQSLTNLLEARIERIVIVTGALTRDDLAADLSVANVLAHPGVTTRHNPDWAEGQSTSVRLGIDAAQGFGAGAVVVGLADQPFITPDAWRAVAAGLGPITVATYDGRRGNPVKLHASVWGLLPTSGDEGARVLMRNRPDLVVEVPCSGSPADIDTVEDLHQWQNN
jgi:molybdenum cofactor cytidylyltransferase